MRGVAKGGASIADCCEKSAALVDSVNVSMAVAVVVKPDQYFKRREAKGGVAFSPQAKAVLQQPMPPEQRFAKRSQSNSGSRHNSYQSVSQLGFGRWRSRRPVARSPCHLSS